MSVIAHALAESRDLIDRVLDDGILLDTVERVAHLAAARLKAGNKLLFAGNGGSAADAQHIATEFVSRFRYDRPALAAIALTTDTSALTAIGNDYGFQQIFSRQLFALGRGGDVFFAISTSGRSPNILAGLQQARTMQIVTVGLSGETGGEMSDLCDFMIRVPSRETAKIQEMHITLAHVICGVVEAECHPR